MTRFQEENGISLAGAEYLGDTSLAGTFADNEEPVRRKLEEAVVRGARDQWETKPPLAQLAPALWSTIEEALRKVWFKDREGECAQKAMELLAELRAERKRLASRLSAKRRRAAEKQEVVGKSSSSSESDVPLGAEHESVGRVQRHLPCGKASSVENPYAGLGVDPEATRKDIQGYVADMEQLETTKSGTERHALEQLRIQEFLDTPYGRLAQRKLLVEGKVYVPLFHSDADGKTKSKTMRKCVKKLVEDRNGAVKRDWLLRTFSRIKSQHRYMVPPAQLGGDFLSLAAEMGNTMRMILRALDASGYDRILVEESKCLISLEIRDQTLHSDQHLRKILDQLSGKEGAATRRNQRGIPPPYSALCSFSDDTSLLCVDSSHLGERRDYKKEEAVRCPLPLGWGLLWHGLFVHAGSECCLPWHARLHMYLRIHGGPEAATREIDLAEA